MTGVYFVGPLDRVLLLRTLPMLEGLGPNELAAIAQHTQERLFERGSALFEHGTPGHSVHLIVEGSVTVRRNDREATEAGPGEALGFIELLSRSPGTLEAVATADTVTLELDWEAQLDVCEQHFPVIVQYCRHLAQRLADHLGAGPSDRARAFSGRLGGGGGEELTLVDRLLVLSGSGALSDGCYDALAELSHHAMEVRFEPDEPVWHAGEPADHFFVLASGSMRCTGHGARHYELHANAAIGLHDAIRQGPRRYDLTSAAPATVLRLDTEPFLDILEDHFDLALDFLAKLASRVR